MQHPEGQAPAIGGIPGPPGRRWTGNLADFEKDRLRFVSEARDIYGALTRFDEHTTIVSDPALIDKVLLDRERLFEIGEDLLGRSLTTAQIDETLHLRPLLNPVLRRARTQHVTPIARDVFLASVQRHRGEWIDVVRFFEEVCGSTTTRFYFGTDAVRVDGLLDNLLKRLDTRIGRLFATPMSWPTPTRRHLLRSYDQLNQVVASLVAERWKNPDRYHDLTGELAAAARSGRRAASAERVAQLLIGSLLAAQKVQAAAAAWMVLELDANPRYRGALNAEAAEFARLLKQGETPAARDSPTARAFALETLRLHPPNWLLRRSWRQAGSLGGFEFPKDHTLLLSPYAANRDPRRTLDPDDFVAERWTASAGDSGTYTFGKGPHGCPGTDMALSALTTILLTIVACTDMELRTDELEVDSRSTLSPRRCGFRVTPIAKSSTP